MKSVGRLHKWGRSLGPLKAYVRKSELSLKYKRFRLFNSYFTLMPVGAFVSETFNSSIVFLFFNTVFI